MSEGEEAEDTEREQEKLGLERGRKAGPLGRGHSGCWRARRRGASGTGGVAEVLEAGALVRVRVRVRYVLLTPGFELGLMVFVTSSRYRQSKSAQALKETNRFRQLTTDPCS